MAEGMCNSCFILFVAQVRKGVGVLMTQFEGWGQWSCCWGVMQVQRHKMGKMFEVTFFLKLPSCGSVGITGG